MAARSETARTAGILSARSTEGEAERRRAFDRVFEEFWSPVTRHVECFLDADAEVYEVVAEVFQLAWERIRPTPPGGLTWLLRLADGVLRDRRRKSPYRGAALDAMHRNMVTGGTKESSVIRQDLFTALERLTDAERRIIVLTYWDGLSVGEVGEVMRRRPEAVRATLGRARERLRAALEGGGEWA